MMNFLSVIRSVRNEVDSLELVQKSLTSLETYELVDGYVSIKDLDKKVTDVISAARKELLESRFSVADVETDEKGHRYLEGRMFKLKAERRVMTPKLDQEKAFAFFDEREFLHKVTEVSVTLTGEEVVALINKLVGDPEPKLKEVVSKLMSGNPVVNENKVSALVELGELSIADVEPLYNTSVNYALKEVKK